MQLHEILKIWWLRLSTPCSVFCIGQAPDTDYCRHSIILNLSHLAVVDDFTVDDICTVCTVFLKVFMRHLHFETLATWRKKCQKIEVHDFFFILFNLEHLFIIKIWSQLNSLGKTCAFRFVLYDFDESFLCIAFYRNPLQCKVLGVRLSELSVRCTEVNLQCSLFYCR